MERMYAPWRLAFVKGMEEEVLPSPSGCIFCDYPLPPGASLAPEGVQEPNAQRQWDRARLILTGREHCFVILNKYPYQNGHVMVVPRSHTRELESLSSEAFAETTLVLRETIAAVRKAYAPHGINVGMNMGRAAGAGIDEHVHWHVVPRWNGDTNFMPVFSDTRVISEGIDDTWERLAAILRKPEEN